MHSVAMISMTFNANKTNLLLICYEVKLLVKGSEPAFDVIKMRGVE